MKPKPVLCPSGRCEDGAMLLGIVQSDGRVGYLGAPIEIDQEFVAKASAGRTPERRFRFGTRCLRSGCRQWTGSRCGVIDEVVAMVPEEEKVAALPACGIRPQCRWFGQRGAEACAVCPLVITDTRAEA